MVDSTGAATTVDYSLTVNAGSLGKGTQSYGDDIIQTGGVYGARDANQYTTLTLSGLTVGAKYEFLVYMAQGTFTSSTSFSWGPTSFQGVMPSDYTGPLTTTGTDVYLDAFDTAGTGSPNADFWYWANVSPSAGGQAILTINDPHWDVITALQIREVPEPASLALLGLGGVLIAARRRRG